MAFPFDTLLDLWRDVHTLFGGTGAIRTDGSGSTQPVSGTVTSNQGTANTTTNAWPIKLTDGTDTADITAASALKVDGSAVTQPISGAVTANAGTNLNTSALALETSLVKLTQTQGSTTSGQSGPLIQGAVTTAAPTYTTAQTNPLSLTTTGRLRTTDSNITDGTQKAQIVDASGNIVTTTSQGTSKVGLDVNEQRSGLNKYSFGYGILPTGLTAAGTAILTMRNAAASTKTVYVEKITFIPAFFIASALTLSGYSLFKFSGATPTGGTAIAVASLDSNNAATQVTDVRSAAGGLTVTGVTFQQSIDALFIPNAQGAGAPIVWEDHAIVLAPGEGLAILLGVAAVTGQFISGHITWSERT